MTIIGTFTKQEDGFQGSLTTLTLKTKVAIRPIEAKAGEKSPDYRLFAGGSEIGAAWAVTGKSGTPYLSVRIDDPSFPAPINARLVTGEKAHSLIWNR